jgi:hypothetical protein
VQIAKILLTIGKKAIKFSLDAVWRSVGFDWGVFQAVKKGIVNKKVSTFVEKLTKA